MSVTFRAGLAATSGSVMASVNGVAGSAFIQVEAGQLASLEIAPLDYVTYSGSLVGYSATGYDAYGNELPVSPDWHIDETGGKFEANGALTTFERGVWEITCDYQGAIAKTTVVVLPSNTDDDDDGIPNWWELYYSLDPADRSDGAMDLDDDGLNNLEEYLNETDPWNADTDGDQLADGFELVFSGTSPSDWDSNDNGIGDGVEFDAYGGSLETLENGHIAITLTWSNYTMYVETSSSVLGAVFDQENQELTVTVSGESGTSGIIQLRIPVVLCDLTDIGLTLDGGSMSFTVQQIGAFYVINAEYTHSVHELTTYFKDIQAKEESRGLIPLVSQEYQMAFIVGLMVFLITAGLAVAFRLRTKPLEGIGDEEVPDVDDGVLSNGLVDDEEEIESERHEDGD
jgi:hypothetical protein